MQGNDEERPYFVVPKQRGSYLLNLFIDKFLYIITSIELHGESNGTDAEHETCIEVDVH